MRFKFSSLLVSRTQKFKRRRRRIRPHPAEIVVSNKVPHPAETVVSNKVPLPSHLLIRRYHRPALFPAIRYLTLPLDAVTPKPSLDFLESDHQENGIRISQSCNGLLLCSTDFACSRKEDVIYYVHNPTINESRAVPFPCSDTETGVTVTAMNIAFDPSVSTHYKVISLSVVNTTYTRVDIYSSETGQWRTSKAEFPRDCDGVDFSNGVFLNGAIHWASRRGETSYYFDVENECFKIMPMPPLEDGETRTIRFFGETGGRLYLVHFHKASTMKFDVFTLEQDYSSWSVKHHVDFTQHAICIGKFQILSMIYGDNEVDLAMVIHMPGRETEGKGLMVYNLGHRWLKRMHPPVPRRDSSLLEDNGFYVVHPFIRTRFAV